MIIIYDKKKCSGCRACGNVCPVDAIFFEYDDEGFWYPEIDLKKCLNCGKCEKVCPFQDEQHGVPDSNKSNNVRFYAAQLKDKNRLNEVSSGGVFQALAITVISEGGIIYGVAQESVDKVFHIRATNEDELKQTRRSKYLQSDTGKTFKLAQKDLDEGKTVLFSGTGCQIAGLNCFLGKRYENLFTCEVICHGVPSYKIWEKYRTEKESFEGKKIVDIVFRDKSIGWNKNQYKISYDDGTEEYEQSTMHPFHAGYLQGLFYRPSCGACPFASMPRVADISLADYWKYKGPMTSGNLGVSLVAVNNSHGERLLQKAASLLALETASREDALDSCRHMGECPIENPLRHEFINKALNDGYFSAKSVYIQINSTSILNRLKRKVRKILGR